MTDPSAEDEAAGWIAEAFETGNALAPLPEPLLPPDLAAGERIAAAVLARLEMPSCGLRLVVGAGSAADPMLGPMLEGRLLAARAPVTLAALRHPQATAGVLAVLAEDLVEDGSGLPAFTALHPVIDIAATRLRDAPAVAALLAADLGGLGQIVVGRGVAMAELPQTLPVTLAIAGRRPGPQPAGLGAALAACVRAARQRGGLPRGAVLVVAGLSPPLVPAAGQTIAAGLGPLGRVRAVFV